MKSPLIFALCVMSTVAAVSVQAQTYQWKDKNGRTVISDTPPPGSAKSSQVNDAAPAAPAATTTEAPKTFAEKDMEFRKRQQEAKDKAEKEAKEQAAAAEKRENCERARRNLAALESSQPLASIDENGQRKSMDNGMRQQEIERARQFIIETCK